MMNIIASERLIDQIHVGTLREGGERGTPDFADEWYADTFWIKGRKYFAFTETETMFTVFELGHGVCSEAAFLPFFYDAIRRALLDAFKSLELYEPCNPPISFFEEEESFLWSVQDYHERAARLYASESRKLAHVNAIPLPGTDKTQPMRLFGLAMVNLFMNKKSRQRPYLPPQGLN